MHQFGGYLLRYVKILFDLLRQYGFSVVNRITVARFISLRFYGVQGLKLRVSRFSSNLSRVQLCHCFSPTLHSALFSTVQFRDDTAAWSRSLHAKLANFVEGWMLMNFWNCVR